MARLPPLTPLGSMRWAVIDRVLEVLQPRSVLEIGCGAGAVGARLASRARYTGLEPDPKSYAVAKESIARKGGEVRNGSIDVIKPGEVFDLVCAFEVIEHVPDDSAVLAHWAELVARGGHILLSTPAGPDRYGPWDAMVGHHRRYLPSEFRILLEHAGFVDVDVKLYGWPLGYVTEAVRNRIAARKGGTLSVDRAGSMEERTARSGRHLQPGKLMGPAVRAAVAPFISLQRYKPNTGIGLVAVAARG